MIWRGDAIGRLLHYAKNPLSSPCTSHKHEQKDRICKDSSRVSRPCLYLLCLNQWAQCKWAFQIIFTKHLQLVFINQLNQNLYGSQCIDYACSPRRRGRDLQVYCLQSQSLPGPYTVGDKGEAAPLPPQEISTCHFYNVS